MEDVRAMGAILGSFLEFLRGSIMFLESSGSSADLGNVSISGVLNFTNVS